MALQNKQDPTQGKIERKEERSKIYQMIVDRELPGERIAWKPSPTESYDLYVQILSDKERQGAVSSAVQSLKASGFTPQDVSEQVYQERYSEEVAAHVLLIALREGENSNKASDKIIHKVIFRSIDELRAALTTDRIAQLFRFYTYALEKDSPSFHYLSQIEDFDAFVDSIAKEADSNIPLVLQYMPSQALAELIVGMARHFINPSPLNPLQGISEFQPVNSTQDISLSTEPASPTSQKLENQLMDKTQAQELGRKLANKDPLSQG